jgi:hypothetical protein
MSEVKILQIIPANDWYACYSGYNEDYYLPIACWALCDEEGERYVGGVSVSTDGTSNLCHENSNFIGYFHKTKLPANLTKND